MSTRASWTTTRSTMVRRKPRRSAGARVSHAFEYSPARNDKRLLHSRIVAGAPAESWTALGVCSNSRIRPVTSISMSCAGKRVAAPLRSGRPWISACET